MHVYMHKYQKNEHKSKIMICKIICCENLREMNSYIAFYYSFIISFFSFVIILVYITLILLEASCFVLFIHFQISFLFTSKYICIFSTSFHFNFYFFIHNYTGFLFLQYSTFTIISFTYFIFFHVHFSQDPLLTPPNYIPVFYKKSETDSRKNLVFHKKH